jgi:hypothetical protein
MASDWTQFSAARSARSLTVPESQIVPLVGTVGWTPACERRRFKAGRPIVRCNSGCGLCQGKPLGDGGIGFESLTYCPNCHASGFEQKLDDQRKTSAVPGADRPPPLKITPKTAHPQKRGRGRPPRSAAA